MPDYITVNNENDSNSTESDSSSSSGSSSLTTSVGSPEPASNIGVTSQAQKYIAAGTHIKFEFTKGLTCIDCVEFDAKKTVGKVTTTIEQLLDMSVLTPNAPMGKVYKYVNIWVGNNGIATPENIENASIEFTVNKAEAGINETEASSVALQRYVDGVWVPLNTNNVGEDEQNLYFQANTTGFSSFVITLDEIGPDGMNATIPELNKTKTTYNTESTIKGNQEKKNETTVRTGTNIQVVSSCSYPGNCSTFLSTCDKRKKEITLYKCRDGNRKTQS